MGASRWQCACPRCLRSVRSCAWENEREALSPAPAAHRFGCSPSEGEQQDPPRIGAMGDQLRDPMSQGGGFARAGTSDDQKRRAGRRSALGADPKRGSRSLRLIRSAVI